MHHVELLVTLAASFSAALFLGFITHRLKLSPIVGYLLAGFLVGPNSPGFIANPDLAAQLAEVGVILLMFGVGLHFDLKDLLAVKSIAVPGALIQSAASTIVGAAIAMYFGMSLAAGLVVGFGVAVSSTVVMMRELTDNGLLDTPQGHIAVGWLIVEDILTVLVLVLLPTLAVLFVEGSVTGSAGEPSLLFSLGMAVLKLAGLGVLILMVGGKVVPWILTHVARSRSRELFTLTILVIAFAVATGSAIIFGASTALGAFLAGMVVGKSNVGVQAAADVLPMKDAFAVLFFVSVGMLFDPAFVASNPMFVFLLVASILIINPLTAFVLSVSMGYSAKAALTVGIGLAQIGEFSFILAQSAQSLNIISKDGHSALVACALISITLNPLLFKALNPMEEWLRGRKRLWNFINGRAERHGRAENEKTRVMLETSYGKPRAIVVGYGPVGQTVTKILRDAQYPLVVVELNVDTVSALVSEGQPAVYGDASQLDILEAAGIDTVNYVLVTLPDETNSVSIINKVLSLNPECKILARARYKGMRDQFEALGVTAVCVEEDEVAKAMAKALLNQVDSTLGHS